MARIAFLMSTFNRANLIGESIRSITSQMGPDDEILIVDDGSTDETHEQVRAIHPPVRYLRQENLGKSAALNQALRELKSTYVWICDDDDLLRPKVVPLLVDAIERTGADVVFGRYIRFRQQEGEKMYLGAGYWPDLSSGSLPRHILEDAFVMHNATLVRRSAYDRVGRFDERACSEARTMTCLFASRQRSHLLTSMRSSLTSGSMRAYAAPRACYTVRDRSRKFGSNTIGVSLSASGRTSAFRIFCIDVCKREKREIVLRAARLQRAAVMGRHDLWLLAISELETAAELAPEIPLLALDATSAGEQLQERAGLVAHWRMMSLPGSRLLPDATGSAEKLSWRWRAVPCGVSVNPILMVAAKHFRSSGV